MECLSRYKPYAVYIAAFMLLVYACLWGFLFKSRSTAVLEVTVASEFPSHAVSLTDMHFKSCTPSVGMLLDFVMPMVSLLPFVSYLWILLAAWHIQTGNDEKAGVFCMMSRWAKTCCVLDVLAMSFIVLSPIVSHLNQDATGYKYSVDEEKTAQVVAGLSYRTELVAILVTMELVHAATYYCIQGLEPSSR